MAPTAVDKDHPTAAEIKAAEDWDVRSTAAYAEIIFRISDDIRATMDDEMGPKQLWDALEKRYSAKQDGLRQALVAKMQASRWNGKGPISAHRDHFVGLRTQIAHTGRKMMDKSFYDYFMASLPKSVTPFIFYYEDQTYNVDLFCERYTKFELQQEARDVADGQSDGAGMALYGHSASGSKGNKGNKGEKHKKRDMSDVTCFECSNKGHIRRWCLNRSKSGQTDVSKSNTTATTSSKPDANAGKADTNSGKADAGSAKKSGSLFTAMAQAATTKRPTTYYVDSGASDHLIPTKDGLRAYRDFDEPVEIAAADSGKIYAYGSGSLHVSTMSSGQLEKAVLDDVYYAPAIHVRLLSLGKLEGQGWDIRLRQGSMELKDRHGDVFAHVPKVNNIYPVELTTILPSSSLVACRGDAAPDPTEDALVERLQHVVMSATARGGNGANASLLTWHRRLGHCSFKTVVDFARSGVPGIVITDLPAEIPGLDACAACVAAKLVHLPHKVGRTRATEFLERVHIDIAGPMPTRSAGGCEYLYVLVDDCTRVVWMRALRRKSETSGGVPYTASTGVRPLSAFVGTRFRVYVAVLKASAHKDLGKLESLSIARTLFVRMPMVRSATPLDAGWYGTVVLSFMPSRSQNARISPMLSSRALSVRTSRSLFPDSLSAAALKVLNASIASDL